MGKGGGADEIRTRDLRRDRPAFAPPLPFPPPPLILSTSQSPGGRMAKDDIMILTGEKDASPSDKFSRRKFFASAAMAAAGAALAPRLMAQEKVQEQKPPAAPPADIKTNIDEVRKIPRVEGSLPGKYPGTW